MNTPASLLVRFRVMPFPGFVITTLAFGTAAPDASRTNPEMLPKPAVDWA